MSCVTDSILEDSKVRRASQRSKTCARRRAEYARRCEARSVPPRIGDPHRQARAAVRTRLARGAMEVEADMPSISVARRTAHERCRPQRRRVSVAPMLRPTDSPMTCRIEDPDMTMDCNEFILEVAAEDSAVSDTTASDGRGSPEGGFESDVSEEACEGALHSTTETSPANFSARNGRNGVEEELAHALPAAASDGEGLSIGMQADGARHEAANPQVASVTTETKREVILQGLITSLRDQAIEAQHAIGAAGARQTEAERRIREAEAATIAPTISSSWKRAIRVEKRIAAETQKKRNREAHLKAMQHKAARSLQEAREIQDRVFDEVVMEKARLLASATAAAQKQACTQVQEELAKAKADAQAMRRQTLKEAAKVKDEIETLARLEVDAAKWRAEQEAREMKAKAEQDAHAMIEDAEAEVRNVKSQFERDLHASLDSERRRAQEKAQQEAKAIKAQALADARALRERALEQLRSRMNADLQCVASQASKPQVRAETQPRKAVGIRHAKALEQKRARQYRKQEKLERQREHWERQALEDVRKQAKAEAAAVLESALAEARATTSMAQSTAKAVRKDAEQLSAMSQATANAEADALKKAAEEEATAIKAAAYQEVRALHETLAQARVKVEAEMASMKPAAADVAPHAEEEVLPGDAQADWEVLPTSENVVEDADGWDLIL